MVLWPPTRSGFVAVVEFPPSRWHLLSPPCRSSRVTARIPATFIPVLTWNKISRRWSASVATLLHICCVVAEHHAAAARNRGTFLACSRRNRYENLDRMRTTPRVFSLNDGALGYARTAYCITRVFAFARRCHTYGLCELAIGDRFQSGGPRDRYASPLTGALVKDLPS